MIEVRARAPSVSELQELGVPGAAATILFFARLNCGYNTGGLALSEGLGGLSDSLL